jgi:DNA-binding transcriptional regulator GbsR (MarR family)
MPPPSPAPQPQPKKGGLLLPLFLLFIIAAGYLAYRQGWFTVEKDPDSGKTKFVAHPEKFRADRDAFSRKVKDAVASGKQKVNDLKAKRDKAPDVEKTQITKEIEEATKHIEALEASDKEVTSTEDEKKLQELKAKIDKLLEESQTRENPKK